MSGTANPFSSEFSSEFGTGPAATANIHVGLAAWAASTAYAAGARVSKSGNAYQATIAGTSGATGPSGTGTSTDGGVTWKWLSTIDYASIQAWANALPNPLTGPVTGLIWNDGTIVWPSGTLLTLAANSGSSATNTITLAAAPGESFRDKPGGAYGPSAGSGVTVQTTGNNQYADLFDIQASYVTIDGLRVVDTVSTSHYALFDVPGNQVTISNCVVQGYSQDSGCVIVALTGTGNTVNVVNTLIVELFAATATFGTLVSGGGGSLNLVNSVLYCPNNNTAGYAFQTAGKIINSAIFGYANPTTWGNASINVSYSIFDATGPNASMALGSGVLFGKTAANQFIAPGTDFRLRGGADCLNAGTADAADLPSATDVYRSVRPMLTSWDIGPFEYVPPSTVTWLAPRAAGTASLTRIAAGSPRWFAPAAIATARLEQSASGSVSAVGFAGSGAGYLADVAGGAITWFAPSVSSSAGALYLGAGSPTWLTVGVPVGSAIPNPWSAAFSPAFGAGSPQLRNTAGQEDLARGFGVPIVFTARAQGANPVAAFGGGKWLALSALAGASTANFSGIATWLSFGVRGTGIVDDRGTVSVNFLHLTASGAASLTTFPADVTYVHFGLTAWAPNTVYAAGNRVSNGGDAYLATTGGTSQNFAGAGPSGTGAVITDGTVTWSYLSRIDYTDLQTWANALPATLSRPAIAYVAGTYVAGTAANPILTLTGHATSPVNTITIDVLPGQSYRDYGGGRALAVDQTRGATIITGTPATPWNWLEIDDANVTIRGLQFLTQSADGCTIVRLAGNNNALEACLFDGYAQAGGATMIDFSGSSRFINGLVVDRSTTNEGTAVSVNAAARIVNCTIVNPSGVPVAALISTSPGVGQVVIRNTIVQGYSPALYENAMSGGTVVDHSVLSASLYGNNVSDGGGNQLGAMATFVGTGDYRLAASAVAIDAGIADVADVPNDDDAVRTVRPSGATWDVGAFEFVKTLPIPTLRFGAAGTAAPGDPAYGTGAFLTFTALGQVALPAPITGTATFLSISASGIASQINLAGASGTMFGFGALGYGDVPRAITGAARVLTFAASGTVRADAVGSASVTALAFGAYGTGNFPLAAYGSPTAISAGAAGVAGFEDVAGGTGALTFSASGALIPTRPGAGSATFFAPTAAGSIVFPNGPYGSGTFGFRATGQGVVETRAAGSVEAIGFFPEGYAGLAVTAFGSARSIGLSASGIAANPWPATAAAMALAFGAAGTVTLSERAAGSATLGFGASGSLALGVPAGGSGNFIFSASGGAGQELRATGLATGISFSASGVTGLSVRAYGGATALVTGASGVIVGEALMRGIAVAIAPTASGAAELDVSASGVGAFGFTAEGSATGFSFRGAATWLSVSADGTIAFTDALTGVPTWLSVSASGAVSQETRVTSGATWLNLTPRARAYQIPAGARVTEVVYFRRDDRVVYFTE